MACVLQHFVMLCWRASGATCRALTGVCRANPSQRFHDNVSAQPNSSLAVFYCGEPLGGKESQTTNGEMRDTALLSSAPFAAECDVSQVLQLPLLAEF